MLIMILQNQRALMFKSIIVDPYIGKYSLIKVNSRRTKDR